VASTKEAKDAIIRRRHLLSLERDCWRGKYQRFTMTEVPEGFSRRQGTDASVISRYARMYLRSVFHKVYIVKGIATSDFRKAWEIQEEYVKKERINHAHHCVDAITIACIGLSDYARLAQYYHGLELHEKYGEKHPQFKKPWPDFVQDMKRLPDDLLVAHYTPDNMKKSARRRIVTPEGRKLAKGDVARGSLHLDTYYGAIERDGKIRYVVRKSLNTMDEKDVKSIVDDVVRERVEAAISEYGSLKKAVEADGVWMNKEKGVRIVKVRLYANSVTRPIHMRQQRDASPHEYKRSYHVQNDRNYLMAIYVGATGKGREKREFELVNNMASAAYYKRSGDRKATGDTLVPVKSRSGYDLAYSLKIGGLVLLYEESPEEVWELDKEGMQRRLYKITGLSSMVISDNAYGTISLVHHQDARPSTDVKLKNGAYVQNEEFRAGIKELHTQFKGLIEGVDFKMNELGEIIRLI
jgi:CRISPR-associated endonuclease Csn1